MTTTNYQLTVYWARLVFELLQREKLDAVSLFKESGIDVSLLTQPEAYFDTDCFAKLWQLAIQESGNPAIGLQMGLASPLDAFGTFGTRLISSATLREAVIQAKDFYRVIGSAFELQTNETSDNYKIIFHSYGNKLPAPKEGYDATLSLISNTLKTVTTPPITPKQVSFAYPEPEDLTPYHRFFDCPLVFSSDQFYILLKTTALDQTLLFANPDLAKEKDKELRRSIKALKDSPLPDQVNHILEKLLPFGEPSIQVVAKELNMSPRTLQRKLRFHDKKFRSLLDGTRRNLALEYIIDSSINLQDIYYNLGFNDHSNFYRAFRRWYGCSPGAYRDKLNQSSKKR